MKHIKLPPSLATRLLHAFIRADLKDDVAADLLEQFDEKLKSVSLFSARLNYWYQVLHYFRPFALKQFKPQLSNPSPMYRNYLKTSVRNLVKNKLHAFINIAGLSIGMAVSIMIALWIWDELTYERIFEKYERIGQVKQNVTNNGEVQTWPNLPIPLSDELRKNYGADFHNIAMTMGAWPHLVSGDSIKLNKTGLFAEPAFTRIFNLTMVYGTADVLTDPSSVLISASMANTFFGNKNPLGHMLSIDKSMNVKVGGVYQDLPENSKFYDVQFIAPWDLYYNAYDLKSMTDPWRPNQVSVYVELIPSATFATAGVHIKDAKLKRVSEFLAKKKPTLFIQSMSRWHLYDDYRNGVEAGGRIQYVWLFGIVGIFVLFMACINFMNLSTARSEKRAKEVGIRKAIGSLRSQLIIQFFVESILTSFLSLILALLLVQLCLPSFNQIAEKHVHLPWTSVSLWLLGIAFSIVIGIVAGSYPALYLSSIKAISVIKGVFKAGRVASLPRKILVTIQFTVSVILIIGTITVFLQIQFAKERPMGYQSNGLVAIPISDDVHKHFDAIKNELKGAGAIVSMAEAGASTTENWSSSSGFDWKGKDPDLSVDFSNVGVSHDYGATINWEILEGRDFSLDFPADTSSLIINEAAAQFMELDNPVGEIIRWHDQPLTVVGVIRDIIVRSPYEKVTPNIYFLSERRENFLILRINPEASANNALASVETLFKKYDPEVIFSYEFIDQAYGRKFGNEERVSRLATVFASLAIFISCLGIFGLSSFVAEQRTKELGVRKVLGATVFQLWRLMSRDFVILVIISCVIAIPTAYILLISWLQSYNYRVALPLWSFAASGLGTLAITLITVSWHTLQAAYVNPATSLRTE